MIDKVVADGIETPGLSRNQRFSANAICRGDEGRLAHMVYAVELDDACERAHASEYLRPLCCAHGVTHEFLRGVGGGDVYAA